MRPPELNEPQTPEDYPPLMRRILLLAAFASVGLAVLAAYMCRDGLSEVLGIKADAYAARDRVVAAFAGIPTAIGGLFAAVQGWAGLPRKIARPVAILGFVLNLGVILGVGVPFIVEYLKTHT